MKPTARVVTSTYRRLMRPEKWWLISTRPTVRRVPSPTLRLAHCRPGKIVFRFASKPARRNMPARCIDLRRFRIDQRGQARLPHPELIIVECWNAAGKAFKNKSGKKYYVSLVSYPPVGPSAYCHLHPAV